MSYIEKIKAFAAENPNMDFYADKQIVEQVMNMFNYDESLVPPYIVESPLAKPDGSRISSAAEWMNSGRREILRKMKNELYGEALPRTDSVKTEVVSFKENALDGTADRKEIKITFGMRNGKTHSILVMLYIPKNRKGKVPVFLGLNFKGNHTVTDEKDVAMTGLLNEDKTFLCEEKRGCHTHRNCFRELTARGYASATACYNDIFPDRIDGWNESVYSLFGDFSKGLKAHEKYSAIGAWAWGLSRIMDCLESEDAIDSERVALHGLSRLGKTALWAGALDMRFKIVISNESGLCGAAMTKRCYGENYLFLLNAMPHWFVKGAEKYKANEELQDFDQHFLLSLIAPRPLVVASALDDQWSDPRGEYLGAYHAGEVYRLFGADTLKSSDLPEVGKFITSDISYHIREGKHDQNATDWTHYLEVADRYL